jgi:preprotein translocase subunit SecF
MRSFEDDIDFRQVWKVGTTISMTILLISLWGILGRGLNLGLDFEGGTSWDVPTSSLSVNDARDALGGTGQEGAKIQAIGRGGNRVLRVQSDVNDVETQDAVSTALADGAGIKVTDITVSTVGPSWGDQVTKKAERALVWFFIAITLYITWRLEWKMAIGALASVVHDLIISVGFYAVFQIEITPATVIAFLTILGYSLYDTIVVFDRMQDNAQRVGPTGKKTYTDIVSLSLNQTLMRSVNTTTTALLPVVAMLVIGSFMMGAAALEEFAVALTVGIVIGAFSSILIASPVVAWIKEREPRFREVRARLAASRGPVLEPAGVAASRVGAGAGGLDAPSDSASTEPPKRTVTPGQAPTLSGRPIPPRPRKKGKRR